MYDITSRFHMVLICRCLTFQVSVEEMVTKKEQIAEALMATQMMLNKHSDKWVRSSNCCWNPNYFVQCFKFQSHSLFFVSQDDSRGKGKGPGAAKGTQPGLQRALPALFGSDTLCRRGLALGRFLSWLVCICVLQCVRKHLMFNCMTNLFPPEQCKQLSFVSLFLPYSTQYSEPETRIKMIEAQTICVCCKHALLCPYFFMNVLDLRSQQNDDDGFDT